jgi:hypothetical protein
VGGAPPEETEMAHTPEELDARLGALEREVAALRQFVGRLSANAGTSGPLALPRGQVADQATIRAAVAEAFAAMGITGEPVGAEKVQEMMAASGLKPEDNEFSRGIIAMRGE